MIKLYDKTGESLIGNLDECISCNVTEVRNGIFDVRLVYPAMRVISNNLIKENLIVCKASDILLNQKFRIFNVKKKHSNTIEVVARHISFDLLYDFIEDISIVNQSCEYALNTIFRNSQFSRHYKGYSDIVNAQDYNMSMSNCLNAIAGKEGSIIDTYGTGAEILRDNENIHVLNRRGHDNGVTIEYGKNLEGFECIEDTTELITRIYPFAKKTTHEGEVTITLDGKFVDSPKINLYSHPYIREVDFTSKFKDDEEITQSKLRLMAEKYFIENKCDIPKLTFNLKPVPLSKCIEFENLGEVLSLCDIATINHKIYGITTQAKVIKTVFNVLTDRYENIQLGDPKASLGDLIGGNSDSPPVGPPGPPGPPGQDADMESFPDTLPDVPQLTANVLGFASVDLSWTYENKVYYNYQIFASKTENFEPNMFDLIFEGQASSFLHQVKPNETWYYRTRAINTHGKATELSEQVKVTTKKIDDFENYFSSAAIENLVASMFTVDYMTAGIIKGHWIDAKNLSVTDGNGKRTLDIDSYGNVNLDVKTLKIKGNDAADTKWVETELKLYNNSISAKVENVANSGISNLVPFSYFKDHSTIKKHWFLNKVTWFVDGERIGIQNNDNTEGNIISEGKEIKGDRIVSLYCDIFSELNVTAKVYLIGSRSNKLQYDWALDAISYTKNESGGKKLEGISIPNYVKTLFIQVSNIGEGNSTHNVVWINKLNLVEGSIARSGDLFDVNQSIQLSIDSASMKSEIVKKVDNDEIISTINQSAEKVKILAKFLELTGYATFTDLASPGSTVIDGRNIKTGFIEAIQLIAPHITGKTRMYLEEGSMFSSDGTANFKNFYGMPGGSFAVESEAWFKSIINGARFKCDGNYVPFSRTGYKWIIESLQGVGTDGGDAIEFQMVGGSKFGVDLWWIGNSFVEPRFNAGKQGIDIIDNLKYINSGATYKNNFRLLYDDASIPNEFTYTLKQDDGSYVRQVSPKLIFPHITLAIQQQQEQINTLTLKVKKLEEQINLLLNKLN